MIWSYLHFWEHWVCGWVLKAILESETLNDIADRASPAPLLPKNGLSNKELATIISLNLHSGGKHNSTSNYMYFLLAFSTVYLIMRSRIKWYFCLSKEEACCPAGDGRTSAWKTQMMTIKFWSFCVEVVVKTYYDERKMGMNGMNLLTALLPSLELVGLLLSFWVLSSVWKGLEQFLSMYIVCEIRI